MNKFDLEINQILETVSAKYKKEKTLTYTPALSEYKKISYQIAKFRKLRLNKENLKLYRPLKNIEKKEIHEIKLKINLLIKERYNIPRINDDKIPLRFFYNRYADEFLILLNKNDKICEEIMYIIEEYLKTLNLTLNKDKTLITNICSNKVHYLGYSLFISNKLLTKTYDKSFPTTRGKKILIGIDKNRIFNKLVLKNYAITKTLEPTHNPSLVKLEDHKIIELYNSVIRGIYSYYYDSIIYKSQLNRIHYILYHSALKTLACKYHTTTSGIFKKFGWTEYDNKQKLTGNIRIVKPYVITYKKQKEIIKKKYHALLINLHDINIISKDKIHINNLNILSRIPRHFEDIWNRYKMNWRSTLEFTKFCNICGSACHKKGNSGTYSDIALKDIYDIKNLIIENYSLESDKNSNLEDEYIIPTYPEITFNERYRKIINRRYYRKLHSETQKF